MVSKWEVSPLAWETWPLYLILEMNRRFVAWTVWWFIFDKGGLLLLRMVSEWAAFLHWHGKPGPLYSLTLETWLLYMNRRAVAWDGWWFVFDKGGLLLLRMVSEWEVSPLTSETWPLYLLPLIRDGMMGDDWGDFEMNRRFVAWTVWWFDFDKGGLLLLRMVSEWAAFLHWHEKPGPYTYIKDGIGMGGLYTGMGNLAPLQGVFFY